MEKIINWSKLVLLRIISNDRRDRAVTGFSHRESSIYVPDQQNDIGIGNFFKTVRRYGAKDIRTALVSGQIVQFPRQRKTKFFARRDWLAYSRIMDGGFFCKYCISPPPPVEPRRKRPIEISRETSVVQLESRGEHVLPAPE